MTDPKKFTFIRCRVRPDTHAKFKSRCAALQLTMEDTERALISWWLSLPDQQAANFSEPLEDNTPK